MPRSDVDAVRFHEEMTLRNRGLISPHTQRRLCDTRIVIAGCGSTGGAAILPLVRTGATNLVLADPDTFAVSNLNRQNATVADIGANKAATAAKQVLAVNPYASVEVMPEGMPIEGVERVLRQGDLVIDAIDVTTTTGIAAKIALHQGAATLRIPVITAYDIAGCQYIEVFDYRKDNRPLGGKVRDGDSPQGVLAALIPATALPEEIIPILFAGRRALDGFPQLAMTAHLFGALVVPIVLRLLDDSPIPRRIRVDLFGITRPRPARFLRRVRTVWKLPRLWFAMKRAGGR